MVCSAFHTGLSLIRERLLSAQPSINKVGIKGCRIFLESLNVSYRYMFGCGVFNKTLHMLDMFCFTWLYFEISQAASCHSDDSEPVGQI